MSNKNTKNIAGILNEGIHTVGEILIKINGIMNKNSYNNS